MDPKDLIPGATIDVGGKPCMIFQTYMGNYTALILGEMPDLHQSDVIVAIPILDNGYQEEGEEEVPVTLGAPERTGIAPGTRSVREEYIARVSLAIRDEIGELPIAVKGTSDPDAY